MMNSDNGDNGFGVGIDLLMIGSIGEGVGINGDHLKASFMAYYRHRRENMEAPLYFSLSLGCPVNSAAPSRNSMVRGQTAEAFCRARGRFAVPDEPRSLRGRLAVLGKPRENRADTEEARGLLSLRGRLAVLGEPREDRAGTVLAVSDCLGVLSSWFSRYCYTVRWSVSCLSHEFMWGKSIVPEWYILFSQVGP